MPATPVSTNPKYRFEGWFKDDLYTTAWDFENDVVTADTTIYVQWDNKVKYTVEISSTEFPSSNIEEDLVKGPVTLHANSSKKFTTGTANSQFVIKTGGTGSVEGRIISFDIKGTNGKVTTKVAAGGSGDRYIALAKIEGGELVELQKSDKLSVSEFATVTFGALSAGTYILYSTNSSISIADSITISYVPAETDYVRATFMNGAKLYEAKLVEKNANVVLPELATKEVKTTAWYTSADFQDNTKVALAADTIKISADTVYYAQETDKDGATVAVTFNSGNYGAAVDVQRITKNGLVTEPDALVSNNADYRFGGWYKEETCETAWDFANDHVDADTTLYAKWIRLYTVRFNVGTYAADAIAYQTVDEGGKVTMPATPVSTDENYDFEGWYKDADFTTVWDFSADTVNADATIYVKWTKKPESGNTEPGNTDSGNTGNTGNEGNTEPGNTDSGNTGNTGNEGNTEPGNTDSGNTGNTGNEGNTEPGNTDSGNTGNTGNEGNNEPGNTDSGNTGNTGNEGNTEPGNTDSGNTGNTGNEGNTEPGNTDSGNTGKPEQQPATVVEKVEQIVDNSAATTEEKLDSIVAIGAEEIREAADKNASVMDTIIKLDKEYAEEKNITVAVEDRSKMVSTTGVKVEGAALNADASSSKVTLEIKDTTTNRDRECKNILQERDKKGKVVVTFEMKFNGVVNTANLKVPVKVTLPIPASMDTKTVRIIHFADGAVQETIKPQVEGGLATFTITGCSTFAFIADPKTDDVDITKYPDIISGKWYIPSIKYLCDKGIMKGYDDGTGTLGAEDNVTRGQFATMLYRMAGEPAVTYTGKFADVPAGKYYTDAVEWCYEYGITTGYSDTGLFKPYAPISRQEIAVMLYRYAKESGSDISDSAYISMFADGSNVSPYAQAALKWCVGKGIVNGRVLNGKNYLEAKELATRGEAAAMLERFMTK